MRSNQSSRFLVIEGDKKTAINLLESNEFKELFIENADSKDKIFVDRLNKTFWPTNNSLIANSKQIAMENISQDIPTIPVEKLETSLTQ